MNTATLPGAANPDAKADEVVVRENPRQVAIDAMTARMEKARETDLNEAIAADPGLAHQQEAIDSQIKQANAEAIASGELASPELEDGAASVEPMHPSSEPAANQLPENLAEDPLSEYIVMDSGKPMFQAKVNGQLTLIPLEQARRQIQIGTAAELRMQQAAAFEQRTTLDADRRERELTTKEQALQQRMDGAPTAPAAIPSGEELSADLLDEARGIFATAFSGTEEEAAEKLARTLSKIRIGTVPPVQIDETALVNKAAKAAVTAVQNVDKSKDVDAGYVQFQEDYPEIMSDANLYNMADSMTDVIEGEHPDWKISQVMLEAGKRTRAWVNKLKGVDPEIELDPPPEEIITPAPPQNPTQTRQERKSELVRMPQPAAGAVHETPAEQPEREQTPQEAFAQLKEARGQPA